MQLIAGPGNNTTHAIGSSGWIHQDIEIPKGGCFVTVYGAINTGHTGTLSLLALQVFRQGG